MGISREEKALREFKQIIADLVSMLRHSSGAETVHMHWVNRTRNQFVLEANSTLLPNVMFDDRIAFSNYFLNAAKDLKETVQLVAGEDLGRDELTHYYDDQPIRQVTILPFVNNGETVALTVIETSRPFTLSESGDLVHSYTGALENVLNTYLELTGLHEQQQEWVDYEESLDVLSPRLHKTEILSLMLDEMQKLLPTGGASLIARGMESWVNVLNSRESAQSPALGLMIGEKSIAYDSLKSGKPEFAIHFNQNPKRFGPAESGPDGATIAIPLMISDRRHGTVIAYDKNALTFKESDKHKLINLVRVASLAIGMNLSSISRDKDLLTSDYGTFIPDLWEKALEKTLESTYSKKMTWFGFLTIANLQVLRSKYRLEELQRLQKILATAMNPSAFGKNGYIGFHSDYIFTFILQGESEGVPEQWVHEIRQMLSSPISLSEDRQIEVELTAGYTVVDREGGDAHSIILEAKKALSEAVKNSLAVFRYSEIPGEGEQAFS